MGVPSWGSTCALHMSFMLFPFGWCLFTNQAVITHPQGNERKATWQVRFPVPVCAPVVCSVYGRFFQKTVVITMSEPITS